jgi:hypothetical protein
LVPRRCDFIQGLPRGGALWCATMAALALASVTWGQSELPPKVQADIFRQEIVEGARNHNPQEVLDAAEQYRTLRTKVIQIPPGVFYLEATAANEIGDHLRAYDALMFYLKVASSADIYYRDALHLYPLYVADPAVKARIASSEAEAQTSTKSKATFAQEQPAASGQKTSSSH